MKPAEAAACPSEGNSRCLALTQRGWASGRATGLPGLTAPPRAQTRKAAGTWAGAVGFQSPTERRSLSQGSRAGRCLRLSNSY